MFGEARQLHGRWILHNLVQLRQIACARIVRDDDRNIGVHAVDELIIHDEHIDAILLDAACQLLRGGAHVEQVNRSAHISLGAERDDDAAAVARHDAEANLGQVQRAEVAGEALRVGAQLAVGEGAVVVDKRQALRAGEVALFDLARGGEAVAGQVRQQVELGLRAALVADESGVKKRRHEPAEGCSVECEIRKIHDRESSKLAKITKR